MNLNIALLEKKRARRALTVSAALLLLAISVILISLNTGSISLAPLTVWKTLFGYGTSEEQMILFDYRMPRIIVTMLAGIGLGVSGAVFQGSTRNSLADPGILGINTGAALGLIIFVSFFRSMEGPMAVLIPLFTFIGGVLSALIIFLFAYDRHRGILPIRLILVGIAVAAGISAVTLLLSLKLDEETYAFTARWLAGSVWGRDWIHVWALLPWITVLVPVIYSRSKALDIFVLGDEIAYSVGSHVTRERLALLGMAVALSCASVSVAGGIGFIGLVAPHIARRLAGPQHRYFLPVAALLGLLILVTADTVGRSIFRPNAIPAGVVVAAIGGPYFLYLLFKSKS
ncbi:MULTISPECIES: iron ABC transporter permease [unclassified Paenibacillus]|uniref:FecCD family ABC transporter permease n=1 Tax=unclassified Paenibacillus TaxID=185978 RepID=UPI002404C350|nr:MULTISPECIES: iron ABC transporter permease [unclassified Paenibacillus]MDF9839470.1 iron complex transport system permease protein [Paenibacillus sp. PastF-2]MDF9846051.1 iron complex transport system permease protein [Paenibacillus sp. PastM-2]MDF9852624.1 iron complex transport system permease protein [Paenibacillus sp. PastF-1]MDH6477645.1 iron complex transport system permease protein [Paenibacillus sp. PastH-2]MDH6505387.1 iron complex transport system permease protein [Paenibacillus 